MVLRQRVASVSSPSSPSAHPTRIPRPYTACCLSTPLRRLAPTSAHTHTHPGCERGSSPCASVAYPRIQQKRKRGETMINSKAVRRHGLFFPPLFLCVSHSPAFPLFQGKNWNNPDIVPFANKKVTEATKTDLQSRLTTDASCSNSLLEQTPAWIELPKVCS